MNTQRRQWFSECCSQTSSVSITCKPWEMQIPGLHPRPPESQFVNGGERGSSQCLNKAPRGFWCSQSLRTIGMVIWREGSHQLLCFKTDSFREHGLVCSPASPADPPAGRFPPISLIQRWIQQVPDFLEWTGALIMSRASGIQGNQYSFKRFPEKKKIPKSINFQKDWILFFPAVHHLVTGHWLCASYLQLCVITCAVAITASAGWQQWGRDGPWLSAALWITSAQTCRKLTLERLSCVSTSAIPREQAVLVCTSFVSWR